MINTTYVSAGYYDAGPAVSSGNGLDVLSGGTAVSGTVNSGGTLIVFSGGIASGTHLLSSGFEFVEGGTESGLSADYGAYIQVTGGVLLGGVLSGGVGTIPIDEVDSGGSISGTLTVYYGGSAFATTLDSGGTIQVNSGGPPPVRPLTALVWRP